MSEGQDISNLESEKLEQAFKNLTETIKSEKKKLSEELSSQREEKKRLEGEIEAMKSLKQQWGNIIKLNVGGKKFSTSKSNLTKYVSKLSTMFSGKYDLVLDDDDYVFIDRDPKAFGHVLNFLRDGENWEPPIDFEMERRVRLEFDFFELPYKRKLNQVSNFETGTATLNSSSVRSKKHIVRSNITRK
eukprot:TRINITY_DN13150_c0_g1_i2.p1 TRINITY_DN13150_c0_g1~~TRINITY_DN13150_c0_g1_i2.p1  ORF type:complete len:215 (-),score=50.79 TRINITY_DN13150_c0_g1_i2:71-634(-)